MPTRLRFWFWERLFYLALFACDYSPFGPICIVHHRVYMAAIHSLGRRAVLEFEEPESMRWMRKGRR